MPGKFCAKTNLKHALVNGLGGFLVAQLAGLTLPLSIGIGIFSLLGGSLNHLWIFRAMSKQIGEINESLHDDGDTKRSS